jgi:hypothetical protein
MAPSRPEVARCRQARRDMVVLCATPGTGGLGLSSAPYVAYREIQEPRSGTSWIEREVLMAAAHEGSEHAERAERRDIGDATLPANSRLLPQRQTPCSRFHRANA